MPDDFRARIDTEAARRAVRAATLELLDLRPFWPRAFTLYSSEVSAQFRAQGGVSGSMWWAPLSPRYARWKARAYPGRGILVRTRRMRSAYLAPLRRAEAQRLILVVQDPKAAYHEGGTRKMPKRSVLDVLTSVRVKRRLRDLVNRHVDEVLRRRGLA